MTNKNFYNKLEGTKPELMQHPDPEKHQLVSFIKSAVRLIGYVLLPLISISPDYIWASASVLFISEVIGIAEELV